MRIWQKQIRASFHRFIESFSQEPEPAEHHRLLAEKLEAVERGDIKRLMVFMPPGAAKSTYANVLFSAWYLGKNPGKKLITASYSQEVADKWGRKVRGIAKNEDYAVAFQTVLSSESQAAGRWSLRSDSEYYAVGVGGSVTSFRADLGIIDDPVKGREEADSETIRKKTIEWYQSDFWTRLKPDAAVVLIMTRWHEEDLAGFLLEEMRTGGEQWDVLSLPMIAEENDPLGREKGEQLWPEWFTPEMITQAKRNPRNWAALYQQRPAPEEGDFFRAEWFHWYGKPPKHLKYYGASDYAVTADGGDYTVHGVIGVDPDDNIYLIDWWRGQTTSDIWAETLLDMIGRWKPLKWAEERGQIIKSMGPFIDKRMRERKIYCLREQMTSASDKATRAQSIRARMSMGMVYFPKDAPWMQELMREMLTFPSAKHDDQVDVMGMFGRMLDTMVAGKVPPRAKKPDLKSMPTLKQITDELDRRTADEENSYW